MLWIQIHKTGTQNTLEGFREDDGLDPSRNSDLFRGLFGGGLGEGNRQDAVFHRGLDFFRLQIRY